MSVRLPTACVIPAALFAAGWCLPAAAKPPDLPVKEQIVCEPPAPPEPEEDGLHAQAQRETARRTLRCCLLFAAHPLLTLLPVDEWLEADGDDVAPGEIPVGAGVLTDGFRFGVDFNTGEGLAGHIVPDSVQEKRASDTACPYLRQQAAGAGKPAAEVPGDPLDNLRKLEEARKLLRQADFFRRVGHPDAARFYYGLVHRLCPGSRYDEVATARLSRLSAGAAQGIGDEEEGQPPEQPSTCPYLREKAVPEQAVPSRGSPAPGSVLDNLEKLEHAAEVYRRAESYRRRGRVEEARGCYESIRDLCPGSHLAGLADDRLKHLHAGEMKSAGEAAGEEEDTLPAAPKEMKPEKHSSARGVGSRVSALLERCQRAFTAGRYAEAETLARRAIALDPAAVAAHPFVYKLDLLKQLRDGVASMVPPPDSSHWSGDFFENINEIEATPGALKKWKACRVAKLMQHYFESFKEGLYTEAQMYALQALKLDPQNTALAAAARLAAMQHLTHPPVYEPSVCPWAAEPRTTMRRPDLPSVAPGIVGAMEKILPEVGEPGAEKVTVTVEEQGADEEQGESPASSEEVPTLLLDPPGNDPAEHAARTLTLQDLLDALRSAACVEVESKPFCGRGQCHVPLGTMSAHFAWDCGEEHGSFLLSLVFGEPPDLRAEQWEYNDRVNDWIATHGGGVVPRASGSGGAEEFEEGWRP
jgi:tetratricopeptide (TPR) repeat protein